MSAKTASCFLGRRSHIFPILNVAVLRILRMDGVAVGGKNAAALP
jgi:hypothetical protein